MDNRELARKVEDIANIGIVNAKHDLNVLREAVEKLKKSDFQTFLGILNHRPCMVGHYEVNDEEDKFTLKIKDFDQAVTLVFDKTGRLIG